jgi:hypothetical protein
LVRAPYRSSECRFAAVDCIIRYRGRRAHSLSRATAHQSGEGVWLRDTPCFQNIFTPVSSARESVARGTLTAWGRGPVSAHRLRASCAQLASCAPRPRRQAMGRQGILHSGRADPRLCPRLLAVEAQGLRHRRVAEAEREDRAVAAVDVLMKGPCRHREHVFIFPVQPLAAHATESRRGSSRWLTWLCCRRYQARPSPSCRARLGRASP